MSYKGLPFEVEWVEFPDIAQRMKDIGASPGKFPNGAVAYTLPVLRDPNTGAIITDSWDITVYLDNTYPKKLVFPKGTQGLIRAFETAYFDQLWPAVKFPLVRAKEILKERNLEYYITTRENYFNQKLEEWSPEGSERDQHWSVLEKAFNTIKLWHDKTDGRWLMGDTFSYADILVASSLVWLKKVLHDDEWKRLVAWNDGQCGRLLADVKDECDVQE